MPKKEDYAEALSAYLICRTAREQQQAARDRRLKMTILKIAMLASVLVTSPAAAAFAQAAPEGHSQAYVASYRAPEGSSQPYVASYIAPEQNYNATITG